MKNYTVLNDSLNSVYKKDPSLGSINIGLLERQNGKYLAIYYRDPTELVQVLGSFRNKDSAYKYIIEFDAMIKGNILKWLYYRTKHIFTKYTSE